MLRWLIHRRLDRFERAFDYDVSYMRDIARTSLPAFLRFSQVLPMTQHREDTPAAAWYAAHLVGTLAEDCGSCTQLVVKMALGAGVPAVVVEAILRGDEHAMGPEAALGWRFARAALAHAAQAQAERAEVLRRWGPTALVSLAFSLTAGRIFPTLKYALGHGHACTRVRVAAAEVVPARPSLATA